MLRVSQETIEHMEISYPGITRQIWRFENMDLPFCPYCGSENTASVQAGIIGRTIYLNLATTKFHLIPNNFDHYTLFCNACGKYSLKKWGHEAVEEEGSTGG